MPRISADVHHQYGHPTALKELMVRIFHPDILPVAVAVYTDQRLEGRYLLCSLQSPSEIPGMPYLVDRLEELPERVAEDSVRIGQKTYIHDLHPFFSTIVEIHGRNSGKRGRLCAEP